jgi:hypothetical protein
MSVLREVLGFRAAMRDAKKHQALFCRPDPLPLPGNLELFEPHSCCGSHGAQAPLNEDNVRRRLKEDPELHVPAKVVAANKPSGSEDSGSPQQTGAKASTGAVVWSPVVAGDVVRQQHPAFCSVAAAQTVETAIMGSRRKRQFPGGATPVMLPCPDQQHFFEPFTNVTMPSRPPLDQRIQVENTLNSASDNNLSENTPSERPGFPSNFFSAYGFPLLDTIPDFELPQLLVAMSGLTPPTNRLYENRLLNVRNNNIVLGAAAQVR